MEVSFYVLTTATQQERYVFACKLLEKAYRSGSYCYVLTDSEQISQTLNDLLWTFRPTSFVPHEIYRGQLPEFPNTILIGHHPAPLQWQKTILNLSAHPPADLTQTEKLLEILDNNETIKAMGRQRYRFYKQLGIEPITHKL